MGSASSTMSAEPQHKSRPIPPLSNVSNYDTSSHRPSTATNVHANLTTSDVDMVGSLDHVPPPRPPSAASHTSSSNVSHIMSTRGGSLSGLSTPMAKVNINLTEDEKEEGEISEDEERPQDRRYSGYQPPAGPSRPYRPPSRSSSSDRPEIRDLRGNPSSFTPPSRRFKRRSPSPPSARRPLMPRSTLTSTPSHVSHIPTGPRGDRPSQGYNTRSNSSTPQAQSRLPNLPSRASLDRSAPSRSDTRPLLSPTSTSSSISRPPVAPRVESLREEERPRRPSSPGPVAAAPPDMTHQEEIGYKELIRNLLHEGLSPENLVERGATPKYVTAVCQEIVDGTNRRKSLWQASRENSATASPSPASRFPTQSQQSQARLPPAVPASSRSPGSHTGRSHRAQSSSYLSLPLDRAASLSSEGSAEIQLIEIDRSPTPPPASNPLIPAHPPPRLTPTSHWSPAEGSVVPPVSSPVVQARAIKIESFRPNQPTAGRSESHSTANIRNDKPSFFNDRIASDNHSESMSTSAPAAQRQSGLVQATTDSSHGEAGKGRQHRQASRSQSPAKRGKQSVPPDRHAGPSSPRKRPRLLTPEKSTISVPVLSAPSGPILRGEAPSFLPAKPAFLPKKPKSDYGASQPPTPPLFASTRPLFLEEQLLDPDPSTEMQEGRSSSDLASLKRKLLESRKAAAVAQNRFQALPRTDLNTGQTTMSGVIAAEGSGSSSELARKNSLLETRRRALESMRARKSTVAETLTPSTGNDSPVPMEIDTPSTAHYVDASFAVTLAEEELERSIAQQVADLEREVMGLQGEPEIHQAELVRFDAKTEAVTTNVATSLIEHDALADEMDLDLPEEGEITTPSPPAAPSPPVILQSLPSQSSRHGARTSRRPGAEDFDSRPVSAQSRKRKPFGMAQKPHRLIISLDDDDSESDSDDAIVSESRGSAADENQIGSESLAEHEEKIRQLRARIAEKMKLKAERQLAAAGKQSNWGSEVASRDSRVPEVTLQPEVHEVGPNDMTEDDVSPEHGGKGDRGMLQVDREVELMSPEPGEEVNVRMAQTPPIEADILMDDSDPESASLDFTEVVPRTEFFIDRRTLAAESPFAPPQPPKLTPFSPLLPLVDRYPQLYNLVPTDGPMLKYSMANNTATYQPTTSITMISDMGSRLRHPDWALMSSIVLTRLTQNGRKMKWCGAEAGGGVCADVQCGNLHFDRGMEVIEADIVAYSKHILAGIQESSVGRAVSLVLGNTPGPFQLPRNVGSDHHHVRFGQAEKDVLGGEYPHGIMGDQEPLTQVLTKIGRALGLNAV